MSPPDAETFYRHCAPKLNWGDLAGQTAMDVGCGRGLNSTEKFLGLFPNIEKLVAIDQNRLEIEMAREGQFDPRIEFHCARIDHRPSVEQWEGQINVIVSHYCLNCINTLWGQAEALANMYQLLESGGTAALLFTLWANFYDWSKDIGELYSQYAVGFEKEPPESHSRNFHSRDYIQVLADIGFEIVECSDGEIYQQFQTDDLCKRYLGSICPITANIPQQYKDEFLDHMFLHFLRHNPRNEVGRAYLKLRLARLLIRKP